MTDRGVSAEVAGYLAQVRKHLADLAVEDREDPSPMLEKPAGEFSAAGAALPD